MKSKSQNASIDYKLEIIPELEVKVEKEETKKKSEISTTNCLVCFNNVPDTVFMNCGHSGVCYECADSLLKSSRECYLCRENIE